MLWGYCWSLAVGGKPKVELTEETTKSGLRCHVRTFLVGSLHVVWPHYTSLDLVLAMPHAQALPLPHAEEGITVVPQGLRVYFPV